MAMKIPNFADSGGIVAGEPMSRVGHNPADVRHFGEQLGLG